MLASRLRIQRPRCYSRLFRSSFSSRGDDSKEYDSYVQIGTVRRKRGRPSERPDLLATNYLPEQHSSSLLSHLHWMMKKDALNQDMCLIGPPGSSAGFRRTLALSYAELVQQPVQVVTITSDLTESDLKQRRELVVPSGGSSNLELSFVNAAPVDAALNGHILLLDGLEKASRNVLPTLNNLLENRSMNLEDGRFLVSHDRYQQLKDPPPSLVPVHPDFRVIATAVPAPPWPGRALDPPLRSRFQIRRVESMTTEDLLLLGEEFSSEAQFAASLATALETASQDHPGSIWPLPTHQLAPTLQMLKYFPRQEAKSVFLMAYPVGTTDERLKELWSSKFEASRTAFETAWNEIENNGKNQKGGAFYYLETIFRDDESDSQQAKITFSIPGNDGGLLPSSSELVTLSVPCGEGPLLHSPSDESSSSNFCLTDGLQSVLTSMLQSHAGGRDILLLSPPGESKSATAGYFASLLGYNLKLVHVFPEMTTRDLFLRRITDPVTGETAWEPSVLLQAIQQGDLCVLDNVEKLRPDVLASLMSLCNDRDVFLPDGRRILRADRAEGLMEDDPNVVRVHPSFRLVCLASMSKEAGSSWLSQDVMSMLSTVIIAPPSADCTRAILESVDQDVAATVVDQLLELRGRLTPEVAGDCGVSPLSTRNLIRITRRVKSQNRSLHDAICEVLVVNLLPPTQRAALESVLKRVGITSELIAHRTTKLNDAIMYDADQCSIGDFTMKRANAQRPEMVPSPSFFDIPSHVYTIKDLLMDWSNGERAFLLLGNQGVGKNMVIDRLCEVANFEREYIQLHRDSTIGQITLQPTLEDGKIVWPDSPLVKAVTHGLSLVVDEADKAPTEVLAVLKGLVEDGELLLGDGRRLSRHDEGPGIIKIHPDFTIWVLANRPGFPFLGNAFFKLIGDCFSTRVMANPDLQSEINLLQSYGPSVDTNLLRQIAGSFAELRALSDHGDIAYPYSTREAVAVVKHLEKFPEDGIVSTLHNVLDFDRFVSGTEA
jgi:MoxR-like ATPase